MASSEKITEQQLQILSRYTCRRLTADPDSRRLTWNFRCSRNPGLASQLQEAWSEDQEGLPAVYYVVTDPAGKIVLYFSLKCGELANYEFVRQVMERFDHNRELLEAMDNKDAQQWAREHIEELRTSYGLIPFEELFNIRMNYKDARATKQEIRDDEDADPNPKLIRVDEAYPAIELVHFCVNDWARAEWRALGLNHSLGETMFWYFVVPKMLEISTLIGCEYVYLFAADRSRIGKLITYYETALHFERMRHIGAIKPQYDFLCIFMAKRLRRLSEHRRWTLPKVVSDSEDTLGLEDYRRDFFDHFNPSGEDLV